MAWGGGVRTGVEEQDGSGLAGVGMALGREEWGGEVTEVALSELRALSASCSAAWQLFLLDLSQEAEKR